MTVNKETNDLIKNAAYNANAGLYSLWQAIENTTDATVKTKLHKTYQVLSLIVETLDGMTPPFE